MSHAPYVFTGWAVVATALAVYAARLVVRERRLFPQVPPEERRWG